MLLIVGSPPHESELIQAHRDGFLSLPSILTKAGNYRNHHFLRIFHPLFQSTLWLTCWSHWLVLLMRIMILVVVDLRDVSYDLRRVENILNLRGQMLSQHLRDLSHDQ
jgi:hypothetical protein